MLRFSELKGSSTSIQCKDKYMYFFKLLHVQFDCYSLQFCLPCFNHAIFDKEEDYNLIVLTHQIFKFYMILKM